jgi:hypothetical protein
MLAFLGKAWRAFVDIALAAVGRFRAGVGIAHFRQMARPRCAEGQRVISVFSPIGRVTQ